MDEYTLPDHDWWRYEKLPSREPMDWSPSQRGDSPFDALDFHLDLGCGTVPKARLGIDRFWAPGVGLPIDLERLMPEQAKTDDKFEVLAAKRAWLLYDEYGLHPERREFEAKLPFPDSSIESIITHHCLEHIDAGFIRLMDECYRVLKPGGFMRIIVPCFPSYAAVQDPDHKRYFMEGVWETFCGAPDNSHWMESFSVPYTKCRFEMVNEDWTAMFPPDQRWTKADVREMRVMLAKRPSAI